MMNLHGFKSKKELKQRISAGEKLDAYRYFEETSLLGAELRDNGTFCVCMDHPKRSKFANVTVTGGFITGVR